MSLLFFDSFKNYTFLPLKWDDTTTFCQFSIKNSMGRKGGQALALTRGYTEILRDYLGKILDTNHQELIVGFAFKRFDNVGDFLEVSFCEDGTYQEVVYIHSNGVSCSTNFYSKASGVFYGFKANVWYYIEIKIKCHPTAGEVVVKVNEHTVLHYMDLNTASSTNAYCNEVRLSVNIQTITNLDFACIEDIYIANTAGSVNNDFLGNCEIKVSYPIGQGSFYDFLPSPSFSGSANYAIVNNAVHTSDLTKYSSIFYEYDSLDDGSYMWQQPDHTFNNTSTMVPSTTCYINSGYISTSYQWFRFSNINIPKNAKISQAYLILNLVNDPFGSGSALTQNIYLHKSGLPASQILSHTDLFNRPYTYIKYTANTTFSISNKDISSSLQELVDLPDWQQNDNSILVVADIRYYTNNLGNYTKQFTSYDANNNPYHSNSPKFFVEWYIPGEDSGKYLYTGDFNITDTYTMSTCSGVTDIKAIGLNTLTRRDFDLDTFNDKYLRSTVISGSNTYLGSNKLPSNISYKFSQNVLEEDPVVYAPWQDNFLEDKEFGFTTVSG